MDFNEVIDLDKKSKKAFLIFKVVFKKNMFIELKFYDKWRSRVNAHMFGDNLAVLVNGFPIQKISIQKGVKQDDSIAHFFYWFWQRSLVFLF